MKRSIGILTVAAMLAAAGVAQDKPADPPAAKRPPEQAKNAAPAEKDAKGVQSTPASERPPQAKVDDSFVIGNDDVLAINVWREPEVSRVVQVRPDGRISLPLVGEVVAAGQTPARLKVSLEKLLAEYMNTPEVTVIVQEIRSQKVNILGEVGKPGSYALVRPMTVLDALAQAGGLKDFARPDKIYVLRKNANGTTTKLMFDYKAVIKGEKIEQNIELEPRDTIVVP